ncbi:hypothetical protein ABNX05_25085 [Lysinibacillus sp. M3]|uniref:Uncharacterized protein n=1 Tax=Lysinibacillus zambalensis TaxID=3160866 RepID=A0ABV1MZC6_9BACI
MFEVEVEISFSNGDKITIGKDTLIFPIRLTEHNGERFCSKVAPIVLDDYFHVHDGYIPELTTTFALNDFFTINDEDSYDTKVYKSSSIVSMKQYEK